MKTKTTTTRRQHLQETMQHSSSFFLIATSSCSSIGITATTTPSSNAYAATPTNPGETIRTAVAPLPGLGPTDIFYPTMFAGNWIMRREMILITTSPNSNTMKKEDDTTTSIFQLEYPVRFVSSIRDDNVVADRGYNQANLEMALLRIQYQQQQQQQQPKQLGETIMMNRVDTQWTETNPNDLRILFPNGAIQDTKVTKRAIRESTESTLTSSEFQRVVMTPSSSSTQVPIIMAQRILTKWKFPPNSESNEDDNMATIEGLELVYNVLGADTTRGMDPMTFSLRGDNSNAQLQLVSKSRLRLVRPPQ
jgi:hypothetical protein